MCRQTPRSFVTANCPEGDTGEGGSTGTVILGGGEVDGETTVPLGIFAGAATLGLVV